MPHLKNISIFVAFLISSCAHKSDRLVEIDLKNLETPRNFVYNYSKNNESYTFLYFNRDRKVLYLIGPVPRKVNTKIVDMSHLELNEPELSGLLKCWKNGSCSSQNFGYCVGKIDVGKDYSDSKLGDMIDQFKLGGFPIFSAHLNQIGEDEFFIEVQYFTECQYIQSDLNAYFSSRLPKL